MKIAIIGAGKVGQALGAGLARAGHAVTYGVRSPEATKYEALAEVKAVARAVAGADVVILATPWGAAEAAVRSAGDLSGKVFIDATNPIGPGMRLTHGHADSGAEQVARWAPAARVIKAFNTTGVENMRNPAYAEGKAAMFVCGDDDEACGVGLTLAADLGFEALHVGNLQMARILEPAALLWINLAIVRGHGRNIALGLMRRDD